MMKWFLDLKMRTKMMIFIIGVLLVPIVSNLVIIRYETAHQLQKDVAHFKKMEIEQVKGHLKNYIDIVVSTIIDEKKKLVKQRKMTLARAKAQAVKEIRSLRYDNGTGYVWINDTGKPVPRMVMHPTVPSLNGKILNDKKFYCAYGKKKNLFQAFVEKGFQYGEGYVDYLWPKPTKNGLTKEQPKMSYGRMIKDWNWIVATGVYIDDIDEIIDARTKTVKEMTRHQQMVIIIVSVVIAVLLILFVYIYSGKMLNPIYQMRQIVNKVSHGVLTEKVHVETKDEFGEMFKLFNELIDNFKELIRKIQHSGSILIEQIHELSTSSQEISTTSNQQAAAVKEIVSTMEDSDKLAKSIAKRIDEVANISNSNKDLVIGGFTFIKDSLEQMNQIKDSNSETISEIRQLGDKIESIWDIVNIINNIADQTKIIAFNAELEASAAGEAGKNFQIVATEIRRLADNTVSSTNEVKSKIREIQQSSDNLIMSSEEGTEKIKSGWELSNKIQKTFEEILSSSEISATSAEQIALSIKQQVSAFEQILLTLKQISEGIDNFVVSTKSTTKTSITLKDMADRMNEIVDEYEVYDDDDVYLLENKNRKIRHRFE